ncbi:MAG TPA: phage holin family protein [Clostridia bacterium]
MNWKDFIQPELLALIPFLYGAGVLIKNTPKIKNWLIPYILWGISIVITLIYFVLQTGKNFDGTTFAVALGQATLLALATVGGNECIKQATVGRKEDNQAENTSQQNTQDQNEDK